MADDEKIKQALEAAKDSQYDGEHHKMWVIDQMVRILSGENYDKWVKEFCDGEEGEWDIGIPP